MRFMRMHHPHSKTRVFFLIPRAKKNYAKAVHVFVAASFAYPTNIRDTGGRMILGISSRC
jgi:hypothetical protein